MTSFDDLEKMVSLGYKLDMREYPIVLMQDDKQVRVRHTFVESDKDVGSILIYVEDIFIFQLDFRISESNNKFEYEKLNQVLTIKTGNTQDDCDHYLMLLELTV